jgi:hypothetical protein
MKMDKKYTTKLLNGVFLLLMSLSFVACAGDKVKQNTIIGLYEITDRQCQVLLVALGECKSTKFIELVRGQFYGIKNNETAIVMWRGDKGEELLYQARKINQFNDVKPTSKKIIISADGAETESLILVDGIVIEYVIKFNQAGKSKEQSAFIQYMLKPVKRGLLPDYRMNYPGND